MPLRLVTLVETMQTCFMEGFACPAVILTLVSECNSLQCKTGQKVGKVSICIALEPSIIMVLQNVTKKAERKGKETINNTCLFIVGNVDYDGVCNNHPTMDHF